MDKEEIKQIAYDFTTSKGDAEKLEDRILSLFGVSKRAFKIKDLVIYEEEEWQIVGIGDDWLCVDKYNGTTIIDTAIVDTCKITHVC